MCDVSEKDCKCVAKHENMCGNDDKVGEENNVESEHRCIMNNHEQNKRICDPDDSINQ